MADSGNKIDSVDQQESTPGVPAPTILSSPNTLPVLRSWNSPILYNHVVFRHQRLRALPDVSILRSFFGTVRLAKITATYSLRKNSGYRVAFGVVGGNCSAPTSWDDVCTFPNLTHIFSNDVTGVYGTIEITPATHPAIEWDLGAEAVRYGHPVWFVAQSATPVDAKDAKSIFSAQIQLHFEVGGAGHGGPIGGTAFS